MKSVFIPGATPPAGHYSPALVHGRLAYVSGQLPTVPGQSGHTIGTIEEQTEQCLRNVERVLHAAGSSLDRVIQMTVYIADGDMWGRVNATYAKVMGEHRPARAVVPVKVLHFGYQIEIQAIAAVDS
ncbi:MAG: RidA family protein [Gemmatimonadetes bacterium]|nr:RidA family protein [Gemmatimonadota bacterium]